MLYYLAYRCISAASNLEATTYQPNRPRHENRRLTIRRLYLLPRSDRVPSAGPVLRCLLSDHIHSLSTATASRSKRATSASLWYSLLWQSTRLQPVNHKNSNTITFCSQFIKLKINNQLSSQTLATFSINNFTEGYTRIKKYLLFNYVKITILQ